MDPISQTFTAYWRDFQHLTAKAGACFAAGDWLAMQQLALARFERHDQVVDELAASLHGSLLDWPALEARYFADLAGHPARELALTFFNSVHARLAGDTARPFSGREYEPLGRAPYLRLPMKGELADTLASVLACANLPLPLRYPGNTATQLAGALAPVLESHDYPLHLDLLTEPFYRNKGCYLVGRLNTDNLAIPFAIALLNRDGYLKADALLYRQEHLSVLFGFARSDFLALSPIPSAQVAFLHSLMPNKPRSELYNALGYYKHGKSLLVSELEDALAEGGRFKRAPGIAGLVMMVFTLEGQDLVFKVIRDHFGDSKTVDAAQVIARYHLVQRHDRVGRMADTQEFLDLRLPLARVDDEVVAELLQSCSQRAFVEGDWLHLGHCFTERRMEPMNLALRSRPGERRAILRDYGQALKEIATAGLFPGDMFYKNFGVTRHGRVIFYDYDELCPLGELHFRAIPRSGYDQDQLASGYSAAAGDVFPEEFRHFLCLGQDATEVLGGEFAELFSPDFWLTAQRQAVEGQLGDFFPYPQSLRF
ncbi:bifunctional isocitrate dehydrogenase kinase/phosphatase [Gallaecimonas kandeliae]|uniref:bifunctional isocitrate dehydrogenase kinase/phosphatase n=1 Tax=Gallaecimonas kandeliae TaxID=3029055 RepID=UPI0026480F43|nr:bifunctional isocitrate dehydrogenase kinase/phosphatase [Gallaecimonas kandeliae]WKE64717.1 bifunctional isocitrate dehydrogenase kinase/phosphatase [Gallaecimonas kandeliae]